MQSRVTYFALGIALTLVTIAAYWHTNKQSLTEHVLGSIAQDLQCADDTLDTIDATEEEKEIYFVGCGGFF